ncbi:hypothetical protein PV326_010830, partial [Microctonus aethiopoides]
VRNNVNNINNHINLINLVFSNNAIVILNRIVDSPKKNKPYKTTILVKRNNKQNGLRFEFTILPSNDGKSNVYAITSIATSDEKVYVIRDELKPVALHKEILKTNTFNKVKNSLKKRYQTRRVWITLTDEIAKTYMDEEGNIPFEDEFLEELDKEQLVKIQQKKETNTLERLVETLIENTQTNGQPSLKNIADKFVIEKFTSRNVDAKQWMNNFEQECARFNIQTDEKTIEIIRLFMDKSCTDWYHSMIIKLTWDSDWTE